MKMLKTMLKKIIKNSLPSAFYQRRSYSQHGEDLIVDSILKKFKSGPWQYLDIGAHHPYFLSNTALLYELGSRGVLVEPNPYFAKLLRRKRPLDRVLQCGISTSSGFADFFIIDPPTLSTFSQEEAQRCVENGHRIIDVITIETRDINEIFSDLGYVDFLNLDTEGLDYDIISSIDWKKTRPLCICVELLEYEMRHEPKRRLDIINKLLENDYFIYADTYINGIFIDHRQWYRIWH